MSDNLPQLLPCPFCGGEARIAFGEYDFNGTQIECKECYASGGHHSDDKHGEAAADSWNRRAAIEANTPAVPDVSGLLSEYDMAGSAFAVDLLAMLAASTRPQPVPKPDHSEQDLDMVAQHEPDATHETNAVLASRYFDLLKVVEAYEKHGVTCQTFRHFVSQPCAECNSGAQPVQQEPLTQPEKQRLWNDATYNNRSSTTDAAMEYGSAIEAHHGITKKGA